jgi:hypothetical protein
MPRSILLKAVLVLPLLLATTPARAQLYQTFDNLFNTFLVDRFQLDELGFHADHFRPAAAQASEALTPALNSLIASNIASFPLSSTVPGVTFDFSTGQPVRVTESLGPIFAESAETLGEGLITVGLNTTYLTMNKFRGMDLDQMQFTFLHQDVFDSGELGDNPSELDVVNIELGLNLNATIFVLSATYGVTPNFDVNLAIPFVDVTMSGEATATVDPLTHIYFYLSSGFEGRALHRFNEDSNHPVLESKEPYEANANGLGDLAVRFKYRLPGQGATGLGALLDLRLPTGDEKNYLGTGKFNARLALIGSGTIGSFTPHLNLGYNYRGAELDSDELEFAVGFDQKVASGLTFAFDVLGELDLDKNETVRLFPGTASIYLPIGENGQIDKIERKIDLSNIPEFKYDNNISGAFGLRAAPSDKFQLLGNILVPLQEGGLRSSIVATVGVSISI